MPEATYHLQEMCLAGAMPAVAGCCPHPGEVPAAAVLHGMHHHHHHPVMHRCRPSVDVMQMEDGQVAS
jgi:hypothetical protein